MQSSPTAAFASWTIPPWATLSLVLTAAVYLRGWLQIRKTRPTLFPSWRPLCFLSGLAVAWLAIASPLDSLANLLLVVHMTQHLLLMSLAPPLIVLGAPMVPMLRGLPRFWVREGLGPLLTLGPVHALERLFKSRLAAWLAMNGTLLAWHVPAAYDLALARPGLHQVEHACFFLTSVWFWWPIIAPWPVRYKGSRWMLLPYLMSADLVNTGLSAFLSFCGRVVYPVYQDAPRLFGLSALNDQVAAGSLMWVAGSTGFLIPLMYITARLVSRRTERRDAARIAEAIALREQAELDRIYALEAEPAWLDPDAAISAGSGLGPPAPGWAAGSLREPIRPAMPTRAAPRHRPADLRQGFDLFTLPGVGAFFGSRWGRPSLQALMLLVAAAVIVDGFFGHPMGSMNLAGIVPWTYARALFVLALLLVGNLFCMSCPFMLPRELAKKLASRLGFARLPWPRALRNKWFAASLLAGFFWAYEALGLWDSPLRTASLLLAYFLVALVLDSIFRGASFCKYVCPLGQFNFVSSLLSPVELASRSQATCKSCATRDCIAGTPAVAGSVSAAKAPARRGCELDLFMPEKSGNLDCTLCMDCVKACPHDNIGLFAQAPARELVHIAQADPQRSSVGRLSRRPDVAALALVAVGAGFASAAVMVAPVAALLAQVSSAVPEWLASTAGLALGASVPASLFGLVVSSVLARRIGARGPRGADANSVSEGREAQLPGADARGAFDRSVRAEVCRWSLALLPLGLGMWAAHLSFHLVTGWNSLASGLRQAAFDLSARMSRPAGQSGMADWATEQSLFGPDGLLQFQLGLLGAGLLFALYLGWRIVYAPAPGNGSRPLSEGSQRSIRPGFDPHVVAHARPGRAATLAAAPAARARPRPAERTVLAGLAALAPWAAVALLLYAAGVWILLQPMQMRGMAGM